MADSELEKKKKFKEEELKKIKEEIKKSKVKRNGNPVNKLIRVSNKFDDEVESINEMREEIGFERLSKPKITELITRHNNWKNTLREDIIHFNIELEENKGILNNG